MKNEEQLRQARDNYQTLLDAHAELIAENMMNKRRIAELEAALKPFAKLAETHLCNADYDELLYHTVDIDDTIMAYQIIAAASVMKEADNDNVAVAGRRVSDELV